MDIISDCSKSYSSLKEAWISVSEKDILVALEEWISVSEKVILVALEEWISVSEKVILVALGEWISVSESEQQPTEQDTGTYLVESTWHAVKGSEPKSVTQNHVLWENYLVEYVTCK